MADDFFTKFNQTVAPALAAPVAAPARRVPHWVWVALAILIAAVLAFLALLAH